MNADYDNGVATRTAKNLILNEKASGGKMPQLSVSADMTRSGDREHIWVQVRDWLDANDEQPDQHIVLNRVQAEALSTWLIGWLHMRKDT